MILCFISIGFIILSIIFSFLNKVADKKFYFYLTHSYKADFYKKKESLKWDSLADSFLVWRTVTGTIGAILLFTCIFCLFIGHVGVSLNIEKDNITYESLCKKLEVAQSEYEDFSKTEVINEIEKWNKMVAEEKYFAKSPWTNWLYSQKRADNLRLIEY